MACILTIFKESLLPCNHFSRQASSALTTASISSILFFDISYINTYSSFQTILSGVPQGSLLGPILFNVYVDDLFLFIRQATLYNYADDNTLAFFSRTLLNLVRVLVEEAGAALDWLKENHMIANPSKFHALLVKKDQTKTSGEKIKIQGKTIESEDSVKLLGVHLDYKLNFDPHISELCS